MSQATGSYGGRCDCALVFKDVQSMKIHIKDTGHMEAKWCTECSRLFGSKGALTRHKATAAKHKSSTTATATAIATPKTNVKAKAKVKVNTSDSKPQIDKPTVASGKPANKPASKLARATTTSASTSTTTNPPKPSQSAKGKEHFKGHKAVISSKIQTMQSSTAGVSTPPKPAPTVPSDPIASKYPWSSEKQISALIDSLSPYCHTEECLIDENYYTGTWTGRKWKHINIGRFLPTPVKVKGVVKREALVIDCEMVGISGGRSELARICIVDLFTKEVLVDSLVLPTEIVRDWRTKYSGITPAMIAQARANRKALNGWPTARTKLFEIADADTILIGHALNHDLQAMHVIHNRVVDSAILVAEAVFGRGNRLSRQWGLKVLCQELLGITIQSSKSGHDCLEDTLASREIVLWCFREREKLAAWAKDALVKYEIEKQKREERQRAKAQELALKRQKEEEKEKKKTKANHYYYDPSDDDRVMSWEEYLEACEYPSGYDPTWSD